MKQSINKFFLSSWKGLASLLFVSILALGAYSFSSSVSEESLAVPTKGEALAQFYQIPLSFEKNEGQIDSSVKYLTRGPGYTFYFTPQEMIMVLQKTLKDKALSQPAVIKMQFVGANQSSLIQGVAEQPNKSNYLKGNDPSNWKTNISNYAKVQYEGIYPGIDAVFYGNQQQVEYDFCLAPGANPHDVRMHIEGSKKLAVDAEGNLCLMLEDNEEVQMLKPFVYQMREGKQYPVDSKYTLLAQNEVGFSLGSYDRNQAVVIDPILVYSTYLGGSNTDSGFGIAVDSAGHAFVTGTTSSTNFPITAGVFQTTLKGTTDVFVTKFDVAGSNLIYSTYLGGSANENGNAIAIDNNGNAYLTGETFSTDFPITAANAFQSIFSGTSDVFVTKLNNTGSSLLYSTFLGNNLENQGLGIAVDISGNAYITGLASKNFPTSTNAYQTSIPGPFSAAFVAKINPSAKQIASLVYSTFLGGSGNQFGNGIAVDEQGHAYIVGITFSNDFPVTSDAFQTTLNGFSNAFVTKFNLTGSNLIYSTYLGGNYFDLGISIALKGDHAYVTGHTTSPDFPATPGAFQQTLNGPQNAFVTQFNSTGTELVYSTFLGGNNHQQGNGIAVDSSGNAYIVGATTSTNFPTANAIQETLKGTRNAFVSKLDPTGQTLLFSSYLGGSIDDSGAGISVDNIGNAYIIGSATSANFPITAGAFQTSLKGTKNVFVAKIATTNATSLTLEVFPNPATAGEPVVLTAIGLPTDATGIVTFFDNGEMLGTSTVMNGVAGLEVKSFSPGTHPLKAVYDGDSNFAVSISPVVNLHVNPNTTLTTLTVSPNPAIFGQNVVFTSRVFPAEATGTVTFFDGTTPLATVNLVSGIGTFSTSDLTAGIHSLDAVYNGSTDFLPSTSQIVDLNVVTVEAPRNLKGFQKFEDLKLTNILKWQPPVDGTPVVSYIVYRNSFDNPIGTVTNLQKLRFKDQKIKRGKKYTYYVVSVDSFGNVSTPAKVTIKSIVNKKGHRR